MLAQTLVRLGGLAGPVVVLDLLVVLAMSAGMSAATRLPRRVR